DLRHRAGAPGATGRRDRLGGQARGCLQGRPLRPAAGRSAGRQQRRPAGLRGCARAAAAARRRGGPVVPRSGVGWTRAVLRAGPRAGAAHPRRRAVRAGPAEGQEGAHRRVGELV
ncbi:MAG: hypothetical protein AVDCRST_MAG16-1441, partial [uncultured Frankineae bacterium]